MSDSLRSALLGLTFSLLLVACGGGGSGSGAGSGGGTSPPPPPPPAPTPTTPLNISSLELAQTHVLPEGGKSWAPPSPPMASESLHLTGGREALALVRLPVANAVNPRIEGLREGVSLGTVALAAPGQLPPTESSGPAYANDLYSATLPANWLATGLQLRARADNYTPGSTRSPLIGADMPMTLRVLPFYLFGANDSNAPPQSVTRSPDAPTIAEMKAKWPVAQLTVANHPAQRVSWPTLVIPPDSRGDGEPAYIVTNNDERRGTFHILSTVRGILSGMMDANGERPFPMQYYAPVLVLNAAGNHTGAGGGIGGGDLGTGDHLYSGIFIHEQGHAFGIPHQGDAFDDGEYPYEWGSLEGSLWGYDPDRREFLAPFVPSNASRFAGCETDTFDGRPRALDALNRCVKQDPMQSGSGDQATGYRFGTFSDYSTAMMQRDLEGVTTLGSGGVHEYGGGNVVRDTAFTGGYKRWDSIDRAWVNADDSTEEGGIFGLNKNLPIQRDVAVYSIVITYSYACTPSLLLSCPMSQIYPPISYIGNLIRTIDPTDAAQRASIVPNTSENYWYCRNGGCDYTVRVTYAGGAQRHVLINDGFRPFFNEVDEAPPASASEPTDGNSFRTWVLNVPNLGAITRIELLDTPQAWNGIGTLPPVLLSR